MLNTIILRNTRRTAPAVLSVLLSFAAAPALAQEATPSVMASIVPTDAIRIEVRPGEISECAPLVAWAFALPPETAGFGPLLPEVPVGYGPTCAVIPDTPIPSATQ
ncbi:hypothetical protein [Pseudooceanicola sp.]|jgi:hypothetical protein|uniref:hypothetical protein n=1 Tax=Pseudooceanicola sp. TaxID=1914328 RepID=UPI004058B568